MDDFDLISVEETYREDFVLDENEPPSPDWGTPEDRPYEHDIEVPF